MKQKSLGQIAHDTYYHTHEWGDIYDCEKGWWESVANAVVREIRRRDKVKWRKK